MLTESTENNSLDLAHDIHYLPSAALQAHTAAYTLPADTCGSLSVLEA